MSEAVKPVPEGYHTITPYLVVKGAGKAIEFYKKAFGAEEVYRHEEPNSGLIMNAQIRVGTSMMMLNDEFPDFGCKAPSEGVPSPITLHLFVEDADTFFAKAVGAGCNAVMPMSDAFWGDRYGQLRDPFGHTWSIGSRQENLTEEQIAERAQHAFG